MSGLFLERIIVKKPWIDNSRKVSSTYWLKSERGFIQKQFRIGNVKLSAYWLKSEKIYLKTVLKMKTKLFRLENIILKFFSPETIDLYTIFWWLFKSRKLFDIYFLLTDNDKAKLWQKRGRPQYLFIFSYNFLRQKKYWLLNATERK